MSSKLGYDKETDTYRTSANQVLTGLHPQTKDCETFGCCIHTDIELPDGFETYFRDDRGLMEIICPCRIGHPHPLHMKWYLRIYGKKAAAIESVHGCCGKHCNQIQKLFNK